MQELGDVGVAVSGEIISKILLAGVFFREKLEENIGQGFQGAGVYDKGGPSEFEGGGKVAVNFCDRSSGFWLSVGCGWTREK